MFSKKYKIFFFTVILISFFFVFGWHFSDARYYKEYLEKNNLKTPAQIFNFISKHYDPKNCVIVHRNAMPRHLMEKHKRLWCDEGSTVIATLTYYAGYKTRLARMINIKNIDNHTFLQVRENGAWNNYDYSFNCINIPLDSVSAIAKIKLKDINHYEYPRIYNKIINANYFLKKAAIFLRGIREDDFVQ
jgi:hypothetical protein